ncbi:hypothetical protein AB832_07470 [Flavobacteriaceae bacterium (ex Bugula neritina AB1)]|nr:hypothetical protein AB832_07260 [Flavobacteriaceae bacterium (ex Bugula neritina AB1)]OED34528.1 hypothetical protein AB832_07470 [Flavobacteriaceae bacterium (ex Bugula neritina AB1)]
MNSKELADKYEIPHRNFKRKVKNIFIKLNINPIHQTGFYKSKQGKKIELYKIPEDLIGLIEGDLIKSKLIERRKPKGLYIIKMKGENIYKIGIATNIQLRLKNLQCGNPFKLDLVFFKKSNNNDFSVKIETTLHNLFSSSRMNGEWFRLSNEDLLKATSIANSQL